MQNSVYRSADYTPCDIRLTESDSAVWDRGTPDERRRLIADATDTVVQGQPESDGCAVRVYHASGRLLAKTVLHEPLFVNAPRSLRR